MMTVKLDVAEFVKDYSRGLRDKELLEKHGLSVRQMVRVVKKLMNDGVITREHYNTRNRRIGELETRQEQDFIKSLHHCPVCGHIHPIAFTRCPACEAEVTSFTSGGAPAFPPQPQQGAAPAGAEKYLAPPQTDVSDALEEPLAWEPVPPGPDGGARGLSVSPEAAPERPATLGHEEREEPVPPPEDELEEPIEFEPPPVEVPAPAPALETVVREAPAGEVPDRLRELTGEELEEISIFPSRVSHRYDGGYRIVEPIAFGAKSGLLKAEPIEGDGPPIAVRMLQPGLVRDENVDEVLDKIIELQSNMDDANVVRLLGAATLDGKRVLLHEYLPATAESLLNGEPEGLPVDEMLGILPQILNAVGYAHLHRGQDQIVRRVPHLNLKLPKLLLDPDRKIVKIGGFGLSKALIAVRKRRTFLWEEPGVDLGQLAPECFVHAIKFVNQPQVDIYALGSVLYRLATGKTLFSCSNMEEYKFAHLKRYPIPPRVHRYDIPLWLDAMILKCLEKDPDERWRSATQMELAIKA
jgi:hypothetical protein